MSGCFDYSGNRSRGDWQLAGVIEVEEGGKVALTSESLAEKV